MNNKLKLHCSLDSMGLFEQKSVGMEISHGGIAAVSVMQRAESATLLRATRVPLPQGCLSSTLKEPQVLQPSEFVRVAREAWGSLHLSSRQVALSLPDSAGQLMLTTLDTPWKRRDEAAELLRWQLGKRLGIDPDQLQLDFQLLERRADGSTDLLVALIHRAVILQYEDLLLEAGLQPVRIGFHSLHLLGLFERFKTGSGQLISLYDNVLCTAAQNETRLTFCRVKPLPSQTDRLRLELTASLAASRQTMGGRTASACYSLAPPGDNALSCALTAINAAPPHQLPLEAVVQCDASLSLSALQSFQLSAALGAAVGSL